MRNLVIGCAVAALVALSAKSEARVPVNHQLRESIRVVPLRHADVGLASWYGAESQGITASGETYDMSQLTAAHRTLPLQSKIKVTNLKNHRSVILRINDRGPNVAGRLLDVSRAAAERLGFIGTGKVPVRVTVLRYPKGYVAQPVIYSAYQEPSLCHELVK
jgi:rare lipoprotein A